MFSTFTRIFIAAFLLASAVGLSEAQIVREGLVSYWSFNEDSIKGDKVSDLWGDNHGQLIEEPEEVEGKYGEALEFTGANHIDIPDSDSLNLTTGEVSVTTWVLRTGPGETERGGIVEKGTGGGENTPLLLREWNGGTVDFEVRSLEATPEHNWAKLQSDSIALLDDVWVFLAGTFDGEDQKIYLNSMLDATLANPGGYTNNDELLRIGWDAHAEERHFVGVIDEVAIYDRALTQNEVEQNMNASLGITSVDPAGKLSSTWGEIKAGY